MRNLVDRVKKRVAIGLLSVLSFLSGCTARYGDTRYSWWPVIGGDVRKTETYESKTSNEIVKTREVETTSTLISFHVDITNYGKDHKFLGRYKIRHDNALGRKKYKPLIEVYDAKGEKIKTIEGTTHLSDDMRKKLGED